MRFLVSLAVGFALSAGAVFLYAMMQVDGHEAVEYATAILSDAASFQSARNLGMIPAFVFWGGGLVLGFLINNALKRAHWQKQARQFARLCKNCNSAYHLLENACPTCRSTFFEVIPMAEAGKYGLGKGTIRI